jgi:hypothetical protein
VLQILAEVTNIDREQNNDANANTNVRELPFLGEREVSHCVGTSWTDG